MSSLHAVDRFTPGENWNDTKGAHINAHGCCVVAHDGAYYWFGENRSGMTSVGVSCYRSTDLYNWENLGLAFKTSQALDEETGKATLERPKVIYNDKTQKWVMYIHWEDGTGYGKARVCVATADNIEGPYEFSSTFRPNDHDSRDQTVFKDTDGKAYHFGSTDMNTNMNVALLSEDYLAPEQNPITETKILNGLSYEAPAIFKLGDVYFGLFSGCTGWNPNPGHSAWTTEILGKWNPSENFTVDEDKGTTYHSQSTYVLKVEEYEDAYIYMGDRWNSSNVEVSNYVWLPLSMRSGYPVVKWHASWDLSIFEDAARFKRPDEIVAGNTYYLIEKFSDRFVSLTGNNQFCLKNDNADENLQFEFIPVEGKMYTYKLKEVNSGNFLEGLFGKTLKLSAESDAESQEWYLKQQEDGLVNLRSVDSDACLTVSGASTSEGVSLYLSEYDETKFQSFGIYFDTYARPEEAIADMFSAEYRANNRQIMADQEEYEESLGSVGLAVAGNGIGIKSAGNGIVEINAANVGGPMTVSVVEAASGKTVYSGIYQGGELVRLDLNDNVTRGVYVVVVTATTGTKAEKILM